MEYNDLKRICDTNKITMVEIASALSMTSTGFKQAMENQTLPIKKVLPLCTFLNLSVSQFFGVQDDSKEQYNNSLSQKTFGKQSRNIFLNGSHETEAILQQLQEKDRQLQEKDKQITRLLDLLSSK